MKKINSEFKTANMSEEGQQLSNRDYFGYVEMDDFACYVLSDSLDEDSSTNSAKIVVDSIKTYNIPDVLNDYESNTNFAQILTDGYGVIKHSDYLQYYKQAKAFLVRNNLKTADEFVRRMAYHIYVILNNGHPLAELN